MVLVGHSYGGAVLSNAAVGNQQVQALVFVAGWMPDEGESIQQRLESEVFGDSLVPAALRPVPVTNPDGSEGVDLYLDRELFRRGVRWRRRRRVGHGGGGDPATLEVGQRRPPPRACRAGGPSRRGTCSAREDRAIPQAGQRFMAERRNAAEQVRLHRPADACQIRAGCHGVGVVVDAGIVHERVAAAVSLGYPGRCRVDAALVRNVELSCRGIAGKLLSRPFTLDQRRANRAPRRSRARRVDDRPRPRCPDSRLSRQQPVGR